VRFVDGSLTPDVLPYQGHGVQTAGEYKSTLAFLRAVKKAEPGRAPSREDMPVMTNKVRIPGMA
jgi:hypothetical protein